MFLPRAIAPLLEKELTKKEITIITGMRQVGKTSLLKHLFDAVISKNKALFDFTLPTHRKLFDEENYDALWTNLQVFGIHQKEKAYIFIDEIQNFPKISEIAKYLYDHYDVKFVFTGSSSYYLKNLFPESLAGRKIVFEVFPLTFEEFLVFKQVPLQRIKRETFLQKSQEKTQAEYELFSSYYKEYLWYGGFPKVILENDPVRKDVLLNEIFASYFEIDIKSLADIREREKMRDLILLLPTRVGQIIDITKISQQLSISRETVQNYLTFLAQTYFAYLIPRFSKSSDKVISGRKKLYLSDSGLARIIGDISLGQLFEQSVFQNIQTQYKLAYYRNESGNEIDFILDKKIALEVKVHPGKMDLANLKKRVESIGIQDFYIISQEQSQLTHVVYAYDL